MVHTFKMFDKYIALDVNSGCVHDMDKLSYDIINFLNVKNFAPTSSEAKFKLIDDLKYDYDRGEIIDALADIAELYENGMLWAKDDFEFASNLKENAPVKAMCLHVSHDCNLRCKYCFADEGKYHTEKRELMTAETGKRAMDYLVEHSGHRRNLEVDFFGGEPLMNFEVVKEVVEYARELEKKHNKIFRFTVTTNGILLDEKKLEYINENMSNIVLSIDGRKEVNDHMRYRADGSGSYDKIVPIFQKVAESRNQDNYYVRGTFTRENLDFSKDVLHLADLGFKQISIEPVVCGEETDYSLREEDLPKIFNEYESLVKEYVKRIKEGNGFNFFHFMIDLEEGPCIIKRLSGCGCGCEYLAVAPNGDVYPCHQFVGSEEYKMGSLYDSSGLNKELRSTFEKCNVYTKPDCDSCFAKFFCSGGCIANACLINGDMNKPHKLSCEMMKKRVECSLYAKAALAD
mgnify:FL=1